METPASPNPVPLTLLTGFLGAGKTTLLNRILKGDHGLRVAVLVNDFGAINIDAELVIGVQDDVVSLANGCVCCTIRDDLVETVEAVLARPEAPEYILLEASGVSDPTGLVTTFLDPKLADRIRLDSVTCVLDADQLFAHRTRRELMLLKLNQIGYSDLLILNKVDLAGPDETANVRDWLDQSFPRLRIVEATHCDVPLEILLAVGRFDPARGALESPAAASAGACADPSCHGDHHGHDHAQAFSTWSYETDRPLSLDAVREAVRLLPGNIYRAKGVIHSVDDPARPAVLQVVGRRVSLAAQGEWGTRPPRSRIVVIGAADSLDEPALAEAFSACIASTAS
ncbi:MAG: GTP-binding protein [Deltaproteobacteria bacterium]|nr:GTP-binding protein [Deltaproteobacteria bacterium]